jgi:hypothetical protein
MKITSTGTRSYIWPRVGSLLFAILLGAQCIWLLLADLSRSDVTRLPTNADAATAATGQRDAAARAATFGGIRGDLWASAAFTYADLLWRAPDKIPDVTKLLTNARTTLNRALDGAPHNSGAWLLLAGLSSRYPSINVSTNAALKMSYYTGPSEQDLIPLRLRIAAHLDFVNDFEMRQFITRDLRFLLSRKQQSAVIAAYEAASPAGRSFIEQAVSEIDPSALTSLRSAQSLQLPN